MPLDVSAWLHPKRRVAATRAKPVSSLALESPKILMRPPVPAALMACFALVACASARTPDTRLPAAYEAPQGVPAGSIPLDQWWVTFNDPELTGLIEQALIHNPDARTAVARLAEAGATRVETLTHYLPQGDVQGSTRRTDTRQLAGTVINFPGFSTSGTTQADAVNFNVSWEVDVFGRFFATRKAVNADLAAARFDYEAVRSSLAANVADAYFLARGLAIQLADANESARIEQELYETAEKRFELGIGARADADRIAGDRAQSLANAASLEAQLQVQRRTLLILSGRTWEPTSNVTIEANVGTPPPVPQELPSDLLARRPDVREAEARVQGAVGRKDLDILAFLPTLTFTPGLGWQKQTQPGFSVTAQSAITGGAFVQPLLSVPRLLAELHAQDARTEQAVIAYEKAVQTAFADSESALVQLDSDKKRVTVLTEGEARSERAYRANQLGYNRGLIDLQTTLAAEQAWRQNRALLTAAEVQALRRTVQAYKSLGGGWPADHFITQAQAR
jgi:NodT family efflux transporter outer membrane factor (OMF) lipoprotein